MHVSIILVNYNTADLLLACINSIIEKTQEIEYEIIVVDNDSVDESVALVRSRFPIVKVIANGENVGFGRANNIGVATAKGEYLWFLNSDTILLNNAPKLLLDALKGHKGAGIAGGNLYDCDMKPATSFSQHMPGIWADVDYLLFNVISKIKYRGSVNFNNQQKIMEIDGFISGADLMVSKSLFEKAGGFDPDFFMYYEETELTYRIKKLGYKIISVPEAKIIHLEGASESKKENSLIRTFQSKYKYFSKTHLSNYTTLLRFLFISTTYQRYLLFKVLGKKDKANYWALIRRVEKNVYKGSSK